MSWARTENFNFCQCRWFCIVKRTKRKVILYNVKRINVLSRHILWTYYASYLWCTVCRRLPTQTSRTHDSSWEKYIINSRTSPMTHGTDCQLTAFSRSNLFLSLKFPKELVLRLFDGDIFWVNDAIYWPSDDFVLSLNVLPHEYANFQRKRKNRPEKFPLLMNKSLCVFNQSVAVNYIRWPDDDEILPFMEGGSARTSKHKTLIASVRSDVSSVITFVAKLYHRTYWVLHHHGICILPCLLGGRPGRPSSESNHLRR